MAVQLQPGAVGHACRYDVLGEFMEYLARNPVMKQAPAVLVAYLGVLTSLASGPAGAQVRSAGRTQQHTCKLSGTRCAAHSLGACPCCGNEMKTIQCH